MATLRHAFKTKAGKIGQVAVTTIVNFPNSVDSLKTSGLFKDEESICEAARSSFVIAAQRMLRADPTTFRSDSGELQGFVYGRKYETVKVTELSKADFPDEAVRTTLEAKITHLRWVD